MTGRRRARVAVLAAALSPGVLALAGAWILSRHARARVEVERRERAAAVSAGPRVAVASIRPSPSVRAFSVVGEARPYASVTLYAKISGYVRSVQVDKGEPVGVGALLAIVESPETDRQYEGARGTATNLRREARRAKVLEAQGLLSQQETAAAETSAQVAEAALAQLAAQKSYEVIRAPFAGTVTARFVDPGALVQNATGAQTSALPLVSLSTLDRLRVQAWVDQRDAAFVRVGDAVSLSMDERPGLRLEARVTRIAGELAPRTRSMLVEIEYDNAKREILPGGYVRVGLRVGVPVLAEVPVDALVLLGAETLLPIVDDDDRVRFRVVHVADTDGVVARLVDGAKSGERVALHLGATVPEGTRVRPVASSAPSAVGGGPR